jgi:hypothetical protein
MTPTSHPAVTRRWVGGALERPAATFPQDDETDIRAREPPKTLNPLEKAAILGDPPLIDDEAGASQRPTELSE